MEFIISFGLLAVSLLVAKPTLELLSKDTLNDFNAFTMDYRKLNHDKVIDNKEFLERRFKFF